MSFHRFFFYWGRKKGEKKQSKEDNDNIIISSSIMATVSGEGIETRVITYRKQKSGIVKGIRRCLW